MTEREQFEAWGGDQGYPLRRIHDEADQHYLDLRTQGAWEAWQAARAQPAQAVPASCGECGKKTSDGWALYCVACMEKAGLPAVTDSPPLTHSCTSSLGKTPDSTAQAVPLLSDAEIVACRKAQVGRYGTVDPTKPYSDSIAFGRAIESAVRAKLGVTVPMTDEQITAISRQVAEGGPEDSIDRFVRAIERHHGIVGKEGA